MRDLFMMASGEIGEDMSALALLFPKQAVRDFVVASLFGVVIAGIVCIALFFGAERAQEDATVTSIGLAPASVGPQIPEACGATDVAFFDLREEFEYFNAAFSHHALGKTGHLPEFHPLAAFQLNPASRLSLAKQTAGDDYFLTSGLSFKWAPDSPMHNTCGQQSLDRQKDRAARPDLHVMIPGNLWLDNEESPDFKVVSERYESIVLWVQGNIYIQDNIIAEDTDILLFAESLSAGGDILVRASPDGLRHVDAKLFAEGKTIMW